MRRPEQRGTRNESANRQCEIRLPLIACLVLFAFAFAGRAEAQTATVATSTPATIDICNRTPEVEAKILAAIPAPKPSCRAVPASSMAAIKEAAL